MKSTETDAMAAEHQAEMHYEREHAGRVRVQMTWEMEHLLGELSAQEHRERLVERYGDERKFGGYELAHVRTEVIEEADDHGLLQEHE